MVVPIGFFCEDIQFELDDSSSVVAWLQQVAQSHESGIEALNYIFVSDDYLLRLNQEHLGHDTYTDIITFPLVEGRGKNIQGDIYISIERVRENAATLKYDLTDELARVMVHGLLHLLGLNDHNPEERAAMRVAEDAALGMR